MSPSPVHKIYALCCPTTGEVRYVGQTLEPLRTRLCAHMHAARRNRPKGAKGDWLRALDAAGTWPEVRLLEECTADDWKAREAHWIAQFTGLLNVKPAGGGGSRYRIYGLPESVKARLGKVADSLLAEEVGVTRKAITYYRKVLGIPASFDRSRNTPPPVNEHSKFKAIELPAECIALLGTLPDYQLASRFGVSKPVIARRRRALGIASYATTTGNNGRIRVGEPHRRWTRNRSNGHQCQPTP